MGNIMNDKKKKVLVTDGLADEALDKLRKHFIVDEKKNIPPEELKDIIGDYNALIIRSATKPDASIIESADNMEIINVW